MKKFITSLCICMMLCLTAFPALAGGLDFSYVLTNPDAYVLTMDEEDDLCFIESTLSAKARHFSHACESTQYWNTTLFDIIVLGLETDSPCPIWRLWIKYYSEAKFLNIHSVTFVLHGRSYTFTDVGDADWRVQEENTYCEDLLIKFSKNSIDFIVAMKKYVKELDDISDFSCTMILHGDEDLTITLGEGFLLDFMLINDAFMAMDGLDSFNIPGLFTGTPMVAQ